MHNLTGTEEKNKPAGLNCNDCEKEGDHEVPKRNNGLGSNSAPVTT